MGRMGTLFGGIALVLVWFGVCFLVSAVGLGSLRRHHQGSDRLVWPVTLGLFGAGMAWACYRQRRPSSLESWKDSERRDSEFRTSRERPRSPLDHDDDLPGGLWMIDVLLFIPATAVGMIASSLKSEDPEG